MAPRHVGFRLCWIRVVCVRQASVAVGAGFEAVGGCIGVGVVIAFGFESLQYNRPATSLIIQSIPPSNPAPVTAEQE